MLVWLPQSVIGNHVGNCGSRCQESRLVRRLGNCIVGLTKGAIFNIEMITLHDEKWLNHVYCNVSILFIVMFTFFGQFVASFDFQQVIHKKHKSICHSIFGRRISQHFVIPNNAKFIWYVHMNLSHLKQLEFFSNHNMWLCKEMFTLTLYTPRLIELFVKLKGPNMKNVVFGKKAK
jgi:hypothetical protein